MAYNSATDKNSKCKTCGNLSRYTLESKLLSKCNKVESGCWLWTGMTDRDGYGVLKVDGQRCRAHRVSYEYYVRPIEDDKVIDHLCRIRNCINPEHLEPVTNRENLLRGETFQGKNFRKTHCKRGHEFTPNNTGHNSKGNRYCKMCDYLKGVAYRTGEPWL